MIFSLGLILIAILGLTIHNEKTLFRVVDTLVIAGLITWLALLAITYSSPTMQHFRKTINHFDFEELKQTIERAVLSWLPRQSAVL